MTLAVKNVLDLIVPEYAVTFVTMLAVFLLIEKDFSKILLLAVPFFAYLFALFGFNALNQVFDAKMDKISKPLRPIPSKRVSEKEAKLVSTIFFAICFLLGAFSMPLFVTILFFVLATIIYTHPKLFFRKFFWATPVFGSIFYAIIPFLCVTLFFQKEVNLLFLIIFAGLVAAISITKDIEDVVAEKEFGINSIPKIIGAKKTALASVACLLLVLCLALGLVLLQLLNFVFLLPIFFSFICVLLVSLKVLRKTFSEKVVTQSKLVGIFMVLVVFIQLLFGLTAFLIKT